MHSSGSLTRDTLRIGFIGLGNMGLPMARRLLEKSGCPVYGFDIVSAALEKLAAAGGMPEPDSTALLEKSDVVFLSLPSNELVRANLEAAVRNCRNGSVIVDTSSSVPSVIQSCAAQAAARGVELIDCPVSGGVDGAEKGTLSAMCGGSEAAVARVMPLLACFASRVTYMGPLGSGYAAKLINNLIVGGEITLIAEAFGLARRAGVDLTRLMEALSGGAAGSPVLTMKGGKMIDRDYTASSRVLIHLKDQHNAQDMARALGADIPACDLSTSLLEKLADMGRGNEDAAAVIDLFQ